MLISAPRRASASAIARSEPRARRNPLPWGSSTTIPSTPRSASPATTPRPIAAHRRCRLAPFRRSRAASSTVTFAPTGTGPRHGTWSTGPGGPTMALTGKGVTTPTPWDWALEAPGADKKQNPTIDPGSCDGPQPPAWTCGANCERYSCAVILRASCGGGACTARARGRLNSRSRTTSSSLSSYQIWDPGGTQTLELKVPLKDAPSGRQGARRGQEGRGEGRRPRDGCGRQRDNREAHDQNGQVGTTRAPRLSVRMEGPPRRPFSLPGREHPVRSWPRRR